MSETRTSCNRRRMPPNRVLTPDLLIPSLPPPAWTLGYPAGSIARSKNRRAAATLR